MKRRLSFFAVSSSMAVEAFTEVTGIYGDTNGSGHLHELNVPTFYASRCVK